MGGLYALRFAVKDGDFSVNDYNAWLDDIYDEAVDQVTLITAKIGELEATKKKLEAR